MKWLPYETPLEGIMTGCLMGFDMWLLALIIYLLVR